MAEFCLDCLNKINDTPLTEKDVVLSYGLDLCEGCGEWKITVIKYKMSIREKIGNRIKQIVHSQREKINRNTKK